MRLLVALLAGFALMAPKTPTESPMGQAARKFVETLTAEQRAKAVLPADSPDRSTWTYVPGLRKGVGWGKDPLF